MYSLRRCGLGVVAFEFFHRNVQWGDLDHHKNLISRTFTTGFERRKIPIFGRKKTFVFQSVTKKIIGL